MGGEIFGQKRESVFIKKIYDGKTIFSYTLKEYTNKFIKIKLDNNATIFSLNQEFSGEKYDGGLLIINNKAINLLIFQTKTGKSYSISKDEVLSIPFELLYVTKKIEKIFDLKIDKIFFSFITDIDNRNIEDLCKKKILIFFFII